MIFVIILLSKAASYQLLRRAFDGLENLITVKLTVVFIV